MTYGNLSSPGMVAARLLADLHEPGRKKKHLTSDQKRIARHMARDGKTVEEIRAGLGIDMSYSLLCTRLRECKIKTGKGR